MIASLGALSLAVAGCGNSVASQTVEFRLPVEVGEIVTDTVEDRIVTTGTLRTRERAAVSVETAGFLILARDDSGARLAEGSLLSQGTARGRESPARTRALPPASTRNGDS